MSPSENCHNQAHVTFSARSQSVVPQVEEREGLYLLIGGLELNQGYSLSSQICLSWVPHDASRNDWKYSAQICLSSLPLWWKQKRLKVPFTSKYEACQSANMLKSMWRAHHGDDPLLWASSHWLIYNLNPDHHNTLVYRFHTYSYTSIERWLVCFCKIWCKMQHGTYTHKTASKCWNL